MNIIGIIVIVILVIVIFAISQAYRFLEIKLKIAEQSNIQLINKIESEIRYYEKISERKLSVIDSMDDDDICSLEDDLVVDVLSNLIK